MQNTLNNPVLQGCRIRRVIPKPKTKVEPGAIFVHSWGYDQTNIDFYMIKSIKGNFAQVVRLKSYVEPMDQYMTCSNLPSFEEKGKPFRKKVFYYSSGPWIKEVGSLWDGKPERSTHYA